MNKKIIFILPLFLLTNCASPGTAFLGPVITGAKTGSVYQASISYSSSKVMNTLIEFNVSFLPGKFQKKPLEVIV